MPEIILLATVCVLFLLGPLLVSDAGEAPPGCGIAGDLLSLVGARRRLGRLVQRRHRVGCRARCFASIDLVWYTRGLSLSAGILLALVLWNQIDDGHAAEAHACLLAILAGTNLVAAANDLVSLFLALELVSIPTYVILYLPRRDRLGGEATIKYFLLSVFSSALVLYGMSWLYGVAGTTNFAAIREALSNRTPHAGEGMLEIAFALLLAGLCFRIAAVPFHFYAPDVFQGTTAVERRAAFVRSEDRRLRGAAATDSADRCDRRVGRTGLPDAFDADCCWPCLAVATMFVGNLMALRQKNLYRLMAYSSIAHAGYMLVGLAVGDAVPVGGRRGACCSTWRRTA